MQATRATQANDKAMSKQDSAKADAAKGALKLVTLASPGSAKKRATPDYDFSGIAG